MVAEARILDEYNVEGIFESFDGCDIPGLLMCYGVCAVDGVSVDSIRISDKDGTFRDVIDMTSLENFCNELEGHDVSDYHVDANYKGIQFEVIGYPSNPCVFVLRDDSVFSVQSFLKAAYKRVVKELRDSV